MNAAISYMATANYYFIALFFFGAIQNLFGDNVNDTVCDKVDKSGIFSKRLKYEDKACYFIVADGTKRSQYRFTNRSIFDKYYVFNLTAARLVCRQHAATLLVIHDLDES